MSEQHVPLYEKHADLSGEEEALLQADEPFVNLRPAQLQNLGIGRQSRVTVLEYDVGVDTYSVLWKRMGVGKGLARDEADFFQSRLRPYKRSLESVGWRVPKLFFTKVSPIDDENQVLSYEEFIAGGDGKQMISNPAEPNFRKWFLVEEVLRVLYGYPPDLCNRRDIAGRELTLLPHGLDLKADNVVLQKGTDKLYFVDLFGPKELNPDDEWLIYSTKLDNLPAENLVAMCATREGALLRFWRLARRLWERDRARRPHLNEEFLDRLRSFDPPSNEIEFISEEIGNGCEWMDRLYKEHQI